MSAKIISIIQMLLAWALVIMVARLTLASRQDTIKVIMATRTNTLTIAGTSTAASAVGVAAVATTTPVVTGLVAAADTSKAMAAATTRTRTSLVNSSNILSPALVMDKCKTANRVVAAMRKAKVALMSTNLAVRSALTLGMMDPEVKLARQSMANINPMLKTLMQRLRTQKRPPAVRVTLLNKIPRSTVIHNRNSSSSKLFPMCP